MYIYAPHRKEANTLSTELPHQRQLVYYKLLLKTIMSTGEVNLPLVDLSGYLNPKFPGDKEKVVAEVRDACRQYGFFQVKGHGVPLRMQNGLLKSISNLFNMPKEEKLKLSFLENPSRRGYEESGMSLRDGDALPDSKEVKFFFFLYNCFLFGLNLVAR